MGGASLTSGLFGGPSTIGSNAYAPANTTPSVMGASGKLEAFDPHTMAGTYNTPTAPTMNQLTTAGMDTATGLPSYVTNFLQQGGTGTLKAPQFTMDPGAGVEAAGAADARKITKANIPIAPGGVPPKTNTTTSAASSTGASAPGATGIQALQMPQFTQQGPLVVNDQWGGGPGQSSGTSQQVATPALGSPVNPFASLIQPNGMMPQFFSDGKGNFFSDAGGKQPVPANVAQILKAGGMK